MTVTYNDLSGHMKTVIETLPGSGIVHTYERQIVDPAKFIALFKDASGKILGWEVTRRAVSERHEGAIFRVHHMVLQGYMGLQDATGSGIVFQNLLDEICAAFRDASPPVNATWQYRNANDPSLTPAQVDLVEDRTFGSVLCHHAAISIYITERIL